MTSEGLHQNSLSILAKQSNELVDKIVAETDISKLDDLTNLFKANQLKKNIMRTNKLNSLVEILDDEVIDRVTMSPESISNKDLIGYLNSTQNAISNTFNTLDAKPLIQINNTTTINADEKVLSRESRQKVLDAVTAILSQAQQQDIIDVEEEDA